MLSLLATLTLAALGDFINQRYLEFPLFERYRQGVGFKKFTRDGYK